MAMRFRLPLTCLVCLLMLSGCWSRRELTEVSFVGLLGFDWVDGRYKVTLAVHSPQRQATEKGGAASKNVWTISAVAPSPDAALAKLDQTLERSLTLSHVRAIVFGEEMARRGIGPVFDFLLRSVEIRPTAWIAVTNGRAEHLLTARPRQDILTEGPLGYHDMTQRRSSITPARRLTEAANILQEEGVDLTLPLFRRGDQSPPNREQAEEEGALAQNGAVEDEIIYGGAGVFVGDRLVDWLTPEAARGHLWGLNRVVHGAVSVECPTPKPDERIVFRIRRGQGKIETFLSQGAPSAVIRVQLVADVNDLTCSEPLFLDGDTERLNQLLAARVRENIGKALKISRRTGADLFGFGQQLFRRTPAAYAARAGEWPELLQAMPVTVQVEARVARLGQIRNQFRWRPGNASQAR